MERGEMPYTFVHKIFRVTRTRRNGHCTGNKKSLGAFSCVARSFVFSLSSLLSAIRRLILDKNLKNTKMAIHWPILLNRLNARKCPMSIEIKCKNRNMDSTAVYRFHHIRNVRRGNRDKNRKCACALHTSGQFARCIRWLGKRTNNSSTSICGHLYLDSISYTTFPLLRAHSFTFRRLLIIFVYCSDFDKQ